MIASLVFTCMYAVRLEKFNFSVYQSLPNIEVESKTCAQLVKNSTEFNKEFLLKQFTKVPYGIGFPTNEPEANTWIWLKDHTNYTVAISSSSTMQILNNKSEFKRFVAQDLGYSQYVPARYLTLKSIKFPCVVKLKPAGK